MPTHILRVQAPGTPPPRQSQLAWKLAALACDRQAAIPEAAAAMVVNRIIDNAGVALAALSRRPVASARAMARARPSAAGGATLIGGPAGLRLQPEWAAWANGTAVRELDFHDTYLAADYSHPGDNIPAILAAAQHAGLSGADLLRGIAVGYEIQMALVDGICLHAHKIDHIAHLGPSVAGGIGAALGLDIQTIYQAIQQALHVTVTTRQSRKGEISSWKAYAPAHAGKLALEAVDRAMRGEGAPSPIYEGTDSVVARILDGPEAEYRIPLPDPGGPFQRILDSYTKAHSAEYQAQALIDLAFRMRARIADFEAISEVVIETSHHTHNVIGTGAGDPQKFDPEASRETLDHSVMYIFAVALQDGSWHHERSYAPERARRADTVRLWHKIRTAEDPAWTAAYHASDPAEKAFGGRATIRFADGGEITEELAVADAHPRGAKPFARADYVAKFDSLTREIVAPAERDRFLRACEGLAGLGPGELDALVPVASDSGLAGDESARPGLFDRGASGRVPRKEPREEPREEPGEEPS